MTGTRNKEKLQLVTLVTDPFGRSASFQYDGNNNLTEVTDMGGYWTSLSYDANVYLTAITRPTGTWSFYIEPADGIVSSYYPAPGGTMWQNYRITVTNPLGGSQEYYYSGFSFSSWHVSPNDYIPYTSSTSNNSNNSSNGVSNVSAWRSASSQNIFLMAKPVDGGHGT